MTKWYCRALPVHTSHDLHEDHMRRTNSTTSNTNFLPWVFLCISTTFRSRSTERTGQDTIRMNDRFQFTEGIGSQGAISCQFLSAEGNGQDETGGKSQQQKYAFFSYYDCLLVNKRRPWTTVPSLHRSTFSMTIAFSIYSIYIGRYF